MIDLVARTIEIQAGKVEKIVRFDVWWVTPFGLIGDLDDAITRCIANDLNPNQCIKGVPVAVTDSSYEVGI